MKESSRKLFMWCSLAVGLIMSILAIVFGIANKDISTLDAVKLGWAYDMAAGLLALYMIMCFVAIIFWAILAIIKKPKGFLIALGCIVVVIGLAVLLSSFDKPMDIALLNKYGNTPGEARLISIACYSTYFIGLAAIVMLLFSEIAKIFKK